VSAGTRRRTRHGRTLSAAVSRGLGRCDIYSPLLPAANPKASEDVPRPGLSCSREPRRWTTSSRRRVRTLSHPVSHPARRAPRAQAKETTSGLGAACRNRTDDLFITSEDWPRRRQHAAQPDLHMTVRRRPQTYGKHRRRSHPVGHPRPAASLRFAGAGGRSSARPPRRGCCGRSPTSAGGKP
jgi:hypothetical protein